MKKQTILFLASGLLALASCGGNASQDNAQAKVDSMQKAMEAQQKEQAMKDSMSAVMAAEKAKADSLAGVMGKEKEQASAKHEGKHSGKSEATTPAAPTPTAQDTKFQNRANGQSKISPADQQAQDAKFKSRGGK